MRFVFFCAGLFSFLVVPALSTARAGGPEYLGAKACGACHPAEFAQWKTTPHARAFDALPAEKRQDGGCSPCHTTGQSAVLQGVQCESCHGPGTYYHYPYVMKDRELSRALGLTEIQPVTCQQCHTADAPALSAFDFKEKLKQVVHRVGPSK